MFGIGAAHTTKSFSFNNVMCAFTMMTNKSFFLHHFVYKMISFFCFVCAQANVEEDIDVSMVCGAAWILITSCSYVYVLVALNILFMHLRQPLQDSFPLFIFNQAKCSYSNAARLS